MTDWLVLHSQAVLFLVPSLEQTVCVQACPLWYFWGAALLSYKPELYEAKENAENLARGALGLEALLKSLPLPHSGLP